MSFCSEVLKKSRKVVEKKGKNRTKLIALLEFDLKNVHYFFLVRINLA